jgi:plastocyanin
MDKVKVFIIVAVLVLVGFVAVAAMNSNDDSDGTTDTTNTNTTNNTPSDVETEETEDMTAAETTDVSIKDGAFTPATITVKKGTTVKWTNQDTQAHDVTPDTETAGFTQSPMLGQGDAYEVTFAEVGTFTYHCTPHPNMKGTIVVTE